LLQHFDWIIFEGIITVFDLYEFQHNGLVGQFYWWRKLEYPDKKTLTCRKSLTNFVT
jgi:hypothetical protein